VKAGYNVGLKKNRNKYEFVVHVSLVPEATHPMGICTMLFGKDYHEWE